MLVFVRYGLPAMLFVAGIVMLIAAPESTRWEGWAMCWGSASALLLLNLLFRYGFAGDKDRDREEAARRYFTQHGRWPDER